MKESMEKQFQEMLTELSKDFHNFCRMSFTDFELLLPKLDPMIAKKDTKWRDCVPSKVRLAVTLRILASVDSYIPTTEEEWLTVESGFHSQFPHAIGVLEAKQIELQTPINGDYRKSFNTVLLALIDTNNCFLFVDILTQGNASNVWKAIENYLVNLPKPTPLPNRDSPVSYVFLGDNAFDLHENLTVPYPGEHVEGTLECVFDRKVLSARIIGDNTFGVMSSIFHVLRKPILLEIEPAIQVLKACVVLHNFLMTSQHSASLYNPPGNFDTTDGDDKKPGLWRSSLADKPALHSIQHGSTIPPQDAIVIRNEYANYFKNNFRYIECLYRTLDSKFTTKAHLWHIAVGRYNIRYYRLECSLSDIFCMERNK